MSPVPPIAHILGLVAGILGGLALMSWVAPDLPSAEPGVIQAAEPGEGDAAESLLSPAGFATGFAQLRDQLGEEETITSLRVTPTSIESESSDADDGVDPDEISTSAPYLIAYVIQDLRSNSNGSSDVAGAQDLASLELQPTTGSGSAWVATLRAGLPAPRRYFARIPESSSVAFELRVRPIRAP